MTTEHLTLCLSFTRFLNFSRSPVHISTPRLHCHGDAVLVTAGICMSLMRIIELARVEKKLRLGQLLINQRIKRMQNVAKITKLTVSRTRCRTLTKMVHFQNYLHRPSGNLTVLAVLASLWFCPSMIIHQSPTIPNHQNTHSDLEFLFGLKI